MFSASLPLSDVTLWFSTHPRYSATPFRRKLPMTGNEFLDRPRRLAERRGYQFMYRPDRGKGSYGPVRFGDLRTVLPDPRRELKRHVVQHVSATRYTASGPLRIAGIGCPLLPIAAAWN